MTGRNKDKIIGGLIGTGSSIMAGIALFSFTSVKTDSRDFKKLVDSKLDKSEYYQDQEQRWEQHDKFQAVNNEAMAKSMEQILKRVDWLYQNEIRKNDGN